MLTEHLGGTPYAQRFPHFLKKLPCIAINAKVQLTLGTIYRLNGVVHKDVSDWLLKLESCKIAAIDAAKRRGMGGREPTFTDKSRAYFHIEELEARFIRHFLASLVEKQQFNSIILLHDGVLLEPAPLDKFLKQAMDDASFAICVAPPIEVTSEKLVPRYHELLQTLASATGLRPEWQVNDKEKKEAGLQRVRDRQRLPPDSIRKHAAKQDRVRQPINVVDLMKIYHERTEQRNMKPGEVIDIPDN
jgi:hypothetical protein